MCKSVLRSVLMETLLLKSTSEKSGCGRGEDAEMGLRERTELRFNT